MVALRLIPCLDVAHGRVVKGVNFVNLRDSGDPVELACRYSDEGADELVFLDIRASVENRNTLVDLVSRTAKSVKIPFTVGGGIDSVPSINDFFDKEIDAINEPNRPIPSGKISIKDVKIQIWVLLIAGLIVAFLLDLYAKHSFPSVLLLALGGSFVSYIYSAPPLKLKQNGWLGNYALGASYIALPWWAGQALFGKLTIVTAILTLAYSLSGLGIAVINDFKSVEGDSKLGLNSLPVVFGIKNASRISAGLIDIFQLAMVVVLVIIGQHLASVILVLLVIPQITFQDMWLLRDPLKFDVKYQASAQPFLITGMLVTALAIGHSFLVA